MAQDQYGNYIPGLVGSGQNLPAGGGVGNAEINSGTTAARNATAGVNVGDLWVLTDSVPPYQLSVWNGTAWE